MVLTKDEGSILPFLIGMIGLVALLAGGVVDLSRLYLSQRALYQVADSAALSAVTDIDAARYYRDGASDVVPTMNEDQIVAHVVARSELPMAIVESIEASPDQVTVQLALKVQLPWIVQQVTVRSRASASARVR